jgi:hypothetical protein
MAKCGQWALVFAGKSCEPHEDGQRMIQNYLSAGCFGHASASTGVPRADLVKHSHGARRHRPEQPVRIEPH